MKALTTNLCVDGTDPNNGETCGGDFNSAPFFVFDIDAQQNIAGPYQTRREAAWALAALSLRRIKTFMAEAKALG